MPTERHSAAGAAASPRWSSGRPNEVDELDQARSFARVATSLGVAMALPCVGPYSLLERIGAGGMGTVYSAFDRELHRRVAVKVLHADHPEHHDRLRTEARALARLSHPHVLTVHGVGEDRGRTYIAMTLVDGTDLRVWARAPGRTRAEILRIFSEAGRGLAAAHRAGVVHRDFKPANVLVDRTGRARVADFGIATLGPAARSADPLSTLTGMNRDLVDTRTSGRFGTPAYMAPEQHEGAEVGPASDQFAFCVALVDVLDGRLPYDATTADELATCKSTGAIVRPEGSSIPEALWRVLERGLSPRPDDRFPSMDALLEAISRSRRSATRLRLAGVAVVAVALAAATAVGVRGSTTVGTMAGAGDPCIGFEAQLQGIWDRAVREDVAARFRETGLGHAEDVWREVAATFDAQAREWVERKETACRTRAEITAEAYDVRQACLTARLSELRAAAGVLRQADRALLLRGSTLSPGEPLESCDVPWDAYWLQRRHPRDVERAREIEAEFITADAQRQAGRVDDERQTYADMRDAIAAGEEDFPSVRAELARRQSQLEPDVARKQALIDEALHAGIGAHYPRSTVPATMDAAHFARDRGDLEASRELIELGLAENRRYATVFAEDPAAAHWSAAFEAELSVQLGLYFDRRGQPQSALRAYHAAERALRPVADRFVRRRVTAFNNIAEAHRLQGEYDEAGRAYDEAAAIAERDLGGRDPLLAAVLGNRAGAALDAGRPEKALEDLERAIAILEGSVGADSADLVVPVVNLGLVHATRDEHDAARIAFTRAETIAAAHLGDGHPFTAYARGMLGVILRETGHLDEALTRLEGAVASLQRTFPNGHALTAGMLTDRADAYVRSGRLDEARVDLDAAATMFAATGSADTAARAVADTVFAKLELVAGDHEAARLRVTAAVQRLSKLGPPDRVELREARSFAASLAKGGRADD